jgi:hypothetical protein
MGMWIFIKSVAICAVVGPKGMSVNLWYLMLIQVGIHQEMSGDVSSLEWCTWAVAECL